tara:strand:+ start:8744 stop:9838 length:1095 start_codon:yes stop_codon:yes gene_type:complete
LRVQSSYLVVRKTSNETFHLHKFYIDEQQICEVIQSPEESVYTQEMTIFVGNKICFEKANDFGDDCWYIDIEEVFGRIEGDLIIPSKNMVYIQANKERKSTIEHGNLKLFNDTTYNPLATNNVVQDGVVLSVCDEAVDSYFGKALNIEVSPGDKVYTHHFLTDTDNEREFNGKKYYEIHYENLYCIVKDDSIQMLNEWNFVVPVTAEQQTTDSGIVLDFNVGNELNVGVVKYLCNSLSGRAVEKEDLIVFKRGREYKIDIEGNIFYRIETNDILYKLENMEALGEIIIVKASEQVTEDKGFVTTVAMNPLPEKGKILSVGTAVPKDENLAEGDTILFRKAASTEVVIEGEKVLLMSYKSAYVKV